MWIVAHDEQTLLVAACDARRATSVVELSGVGALKRNEPLPRRSEQRLTKATSGRHSERVEVGTGAVHRELATALARNHVASTVLLKQALGEDFADFLFERIILAPEELEIEQRLRERTLIKRAQSGHSTRLFELSRIASNANKFEILTPN
jgi:hypothetical protein